jgi:glycosyltransferase involved in cell wall biosynthesis
MKRKRKPRFGTPLHIGFLTNGYAGIGQPESGVGNYLTRIAPLLVQRGHDCDVFCTSEGQPMRYESIERIDGVTVHLLPDDDSRMAEFSCLTPQFPRTPIAHSWRLASKANEVHLHRPFDAVQVPNFQFGAVFLEVDVPIVMRMSSYSPLWREAETHQASNHAYPVEWYMEFMLERESIAASDAYYAPSSFLCNCYRERLQLDVKLIRPPAYSELERSKWDDEWIREVAAGRTPYLAFVNAINRRKGGHILAAALPRFFEACPDVHLHMMGQELDCVQAIFQAAGSHREQVHYYGMQGHHRAYPLIAGAIGLVFPSLVDNLPNTVIEALVLGVPPIVARGSSADELLGEGSAGIIVPPADPQALADAMIRMAKMPPETRHAMGHAGKAFVKRILDPERAVMSLEEFFWSLSGMPRRRRVLARQRLRMLADTLADYHKISFSATQEKEKRTAFAPLIAALVRNNRYSVVIYGAGEAGQTLARELELFGIEIRAFVDSASSLWGKSLNGVRVVPLDEAIQRGYTEFAVGSLAFAGQIEQQIRSAFESRTETPEIYLPRNPTASPCT